MCQSKSNVAYEISFDRLTYVKRYNLYGLGAISIPFLSDLILHQSVTSLYSNLSSDVL